MFEETIEISPSFKTPSFKTPFYYVYRDSFDMDNNYWSVEFCPGIGDGGIIIGKFHISRKVLNDDVRGIIFASVEHIIMSRDVILNEIPVYTIWDGIGISKEKIFGRRI